MVGLARGLKSGQTLVQLLGLIITRFAKVEDPIVQDFLPGAPECFLAGIVIKIIKVNLRMVASKRIYSGQPPLNFMNFLPRR